MKSFTLDHNCLIDLDQEREQASQVRLLSESSRSGRLEGAVVATSASERLRDGSLPTDFAAFQAWMLRLDLDHLLCLRPLGRWGVSFWDHCLWADEKSGELETKIFRELFPTSEPKWADEAANRGVETQDTGSRAYLKWRNRILDAQIFWAHLNTKRQVFITSDANFQKKLSGRDEYPTKIATPWEACRLLDVC